MPDSPLQEPFMKELVETLRATQSRVAEALGRDDPEVARELEGLCFGMLVMLDGGTPLADHGLVRIVDEAGREFDRNLHEQLPHYLR